MAALIAFVLLAVTLGFTVGLGAPWVAVCWPVGFMRFFERELVGAPVPG